VAEVIFSRFVFVRPFFLSFFLSSFVLRCFSKGVKQEGLCGAFFSPRLFSLEYVDDDDGQEIE
jgi:hypothetical protein